MFGLLGGGVGVIVGTGKVKVNVDFSYVNYLNNLNVLRHYSMVKVDL